MRRTSFRTMNCSIAQCLEVVGEWWSMLIVRDAFMGVTRFDDFQARLGISRNVLNQRLGHLVDEGVFERVPYQDNPPRHDYRLTAKGRDLWLVLTAMREWGDRWAPGKGGPTVEMRHRGCDHITTIAAACAHCGEPVSPRDLIPVPGPGATDPDFIRLPVG
ncbi:MAG TPA: helix-turn-helix domain-containing protein [Acidimicrobiales bacterium]|nr:helix-turn-helix domain-containing protein [Acidimicrobiales bacterium]